MASKGPKIIQSFRLGLRKLLGGSPEEPKIIESTTKASQIQKPNNEGSNTKEQTSPPSHNPFGILIDPMSNVPERPFIPPLERVNDKVANSDAKEVSAVLEIATEDSKTKEEIKTETGEKAIENNKIDKEVAENAKFVSTSMEDKSVDVKENENKLKVEDVVPLTANPDIKISEPETPKNTVRTFEAMTPIRQVIKPHTPLIRFRKGVPVTVTDHAVAQNAELISKETKDELTESSVPPSAGKWKSSPVLHEWWDTPVRFKRREVDELECDIINGGGCDKIYQ